MTSQVRPRKQHAQRIYRLQNTQDATLLRRPHRYLDYSLGAVRLFFASDQGEFSIFEYVLFAILALAVSFGTIVTVISWLIRFHKL